MLNENSITSHNKYLQDAESFEKQLEQNILSSSAVEGVFLPKNFDKKSNVLLEHKDPKNHQV